jgi:hypothetical protein
VRLICGVLFDAKVNSLIWLKRAPVDNQDSSLGSQDYLGIKPTTNNWSVVVPYEVAFQSFSSELAAVLDGLARLPHCFMVTNIVVEPAATASSATEEPASMYTQRYGPAVDQSQRAMERYGGRYGGRGRMMPQPVQPQPVQVRPASRGPATVLEEKPLRFTLSINAVKLKTTK